MKKIYSFYNIQPFDGHIGVRVPERKNYINIYWCIQMWNNQMLKQ